MSNCEICNQEAAFKCACRSIFLCNKHVKQHQSQPGNHKISSIGGKKGNKSVQFVKEKDSQAEEQKSRQRVKVSNKDSEDPRNIMKNILLSEKQRLKNFEMEANESLNVLTERLIDSIIQQTKQLSSQIISQCKEKEEMLVNALQEIDNSQDVPVGNPIVERIKESNDLNAEIITLSGNVEDIAFSYDNVLDLQVSLLSLQSINELQAFYDQHQASMHSKIKRLYTQVFEEQHYKVKKVNVAHANLGKSGLESFTKVIIHYQALEVLKISNNDLEQEGAEELSNAIQELKHLSFIDLGQNDLRGRGLEAMASALSKLRELQRLSLNKNNLQASGARHLSMISNSLQRLKELDLDQNHLGSEGARNLAGGLSKLINLKTLKLRDNNFQTDCVKFMTSSLGRLNKLELLKLEGNNFSQEDKKQLQSVVRPGCKVDF